jgi:ribosomal protein L18E
MQLSQLTKTNNDLARKLEILTELGESDRAEQTVKDMSDKLLEKVSELEQNLVLAKIESATKESEILV